MRQFIEALISDASRETVKRKQYKKVPDVCHEKLNGELTNRWNEIIKVGNWSALWCSISFRHWAPDCSKNRCLINLKRWSQGSTGKN